MEQSGQIDNTNFKDSKYIGDPLNTVRIFNEKQLSLIPYAEAIDITGEGSLDLIEAEEIRTSPVKTSLPDANWVSLQNICGG